MTPHKEYSTNPPKVSPSYSNTPTAVDYNKPKFSQYPYPGGVNQSYPINVTTMPVALKHDNKPNSSVTKK